MNIYMYTVYTYLSVDIYECMSNVSITCSFCRFVSRPLYLMLYSYVYLSLPQFNLNMYINYM